MCEYEQIGLRYYKPKDWSHWEWMDFIDELRGDCDWNESIRTGVDEDGQEYYYHVRRVD